MLCGVKGPPRSSFRLIEAAFAKDANSYFKYLFLPHSHSALPEGQNHLPVLQPGEVESRSPDHPCFVLAAAAHAHTHVHSCFYTGLLEPWHLSRDGNFGLSAVSDSPSHSAELSGMEEY